MRAANLFSLRWAGLSLCALTGLLAGCSAPVYEVKVDSISKPAANEEAQSFRIKSKDPRLGEESLRYREVAEYVRTAMSGKGLYEAPSDDRAAMIVELEYGMQTPRTKMETVSVPVYNQVGGGVKYEPVKVVDTRGIVSSKNVAVYDPPREELVGYEEQERQVTVYEKYIRLTARENKPGTEGHPPAQLWSVVVSAEDESKDLRKYLPIMASASIDYIGQDSTNQKVVRVREDAPDVNFIRRGMNGGDTQLTITSTTRPKS